MKNFFVLIVLLGAFAVSAQSEYIVEINRSTGNFQTISNPIPFVTNVAENLRTYDRVHGAYYFLSTTNCSCVVSVDISTGDLLYQHQMPIVSFQYDNLASKLFGFRIMPSTFQRQFGEIDTATGAFTQIGNDIAVPGSVPHNWSCYNANQKLYFIEDGLNHWSTVSANTGAILAGQTLSLAPNETLFSPCFNEYNDSLYALVYNSVFQKTWLATFDVGSGSVTKIGSGILNYFGNNGSATIDPVRKQFLHLSRLGSLFYINTFDLMSGAYVETNDLKPIQTGNYFYNLEYDQTRDKLFALHRSTGPDALGVVEANQQKLGLKRNYEGTEYELTSIDEISSIELKDMLGKSVSSPIYNENGKWLIEKGTLSAGTYFLICKSGAEIVSTEKLLFN